MVKISVIIPTCNRPSLLERAVRSVLAQTFSAFEIIVVNDAGESIEQLICELNTKRECITLLNTPQKSGVSAVRNLALSKAQGKYIAYLDDDDYYYPEHLETLHNYLENNNEKVVYSNSLCTIQELQNNTWITLEKKLQFNNEFDPDQLLISNYIPILNIMHAKECLEKSGLFDETLFTHEDWDLWIRMSRHYTFCHIDQVTAEYTHRPIEEQDKKRKIYRENFTDTRKLIYEKYADFVANKPELKDLQQKAVKQEQFSREIAAQIVSFVQGIKEKLIARDIKGAWEYYEKYRPPEEPSGIVKAELASIDMLMQSLPR